MSKQYKVIGTRINTDGKADYKWQYSYTNGKPVLMSKENAESKADDLRANKAYPMRDVQIVEV